MGRGCSGAGPHLCCWAKGRGEDTSSLKLHGGGAGMSVAVRSGNVLSSYFYAQIINIIYVNGSTIWGSLCPWIQDKNLTVVLGKWLKTCPNWWPSTETQSPAGCPSRSTTPTLGSQCPKRCPFPQEHPSYLVRLHLQGA